MKVLYITSDILNEKKVKMISNAITVFLKATFL